MDKKNAMKALTLLMILIVINIGAAMTGETVFKIVLPSTIAGLVVLSQWDRFGR